VKDKNMVAPLDEIRSYKIPSKCPRPRDDECLRRRVRAEEQIPQQRERLPESVYKGSADMALAVVIVRLESEMLQVSHHEGGRW
jgi:hypothetical protein